MNTNHFEDTNLVITQWDRSDYSPCYPCHIGVDDLGTFQCMDCLCLFHGKQAYKQVIKCLKEQYGGLWKKEYRKLKEIKTLVRAKKFDKLTTHIYTYWNEDEKIHTDRYFYEKR